MRNCTVACCTQCSPARFLGSSWDQAMRFPNKSGRQPIWIHQWRAASFAMCSPHVRPPVYCVKCWLVGRLLRQRHDCTQRFHAANRQKTQVWRLLDEKLPERRFPVGSYSNFSVRQAKPGEGEWIDLKPFVRAQRVANPPGKAGQPSGSESCVVVGQPTLRSVDSEWRAV